MISKMSVRNFKSLLNVHVGLERFTVFVGPNASGKSSLLQAMDLLCRVFRVDNQHQLEPEAKQCMSRRADGQVELACESSGQAYRYRIRALSTPPNRASPAGMKWAGEGRAVAATLGDSGWGEWKPVRSDSSPLPNSVLLRLEISKLVNPAPVAQDRTAMLPNGTGLHVALATMALNDPDSWQALQANLRGIIPTVRRLRHTKAAPLQQPPALLFDTVGADSLPASQVSEGTLLVVGLLAALHAPDRPSLVLLDDLDRGLHPKAQKDLITLLRELLGTNPDLQIVATTHSPYMLDCMGTNEVRMTSLRDDGATVCAALTDHPKFPKWKDEMTPGEMWSLFGEKWMVEQEVKA